MQPTHGGRGHVQQIPVIASLLLAQGVLLLLYGLMMGGFAIFFTQSDMFLPQDANRPQEVDEMVGWILPLVYGIMGGVVAILSIFHFVAAYLNFNYKGRTFGIVTMACGLVSSFTCYCAPTAIGLLVYGLIIYFKPAVSHAFELRRSGMTKQQILEQFPT